MAASKVRTDYEQLKGAAGRFGSQAQAARQTLQSIQRQVDLLQGGDWIGQGASAFYQEMGGQVLPTLNRLAAALETAQQTTTQIGQLMAQAEAEAARVLHAGGARAAAAGLAGVAAGPNGGASASAGAAAGPAPSGAAAAGGAAGGAPAPRNTPAPPGSLAEAVGRMAAQDNAAVDRVLAKFPADVRDIIKKSPTLKAQISKLDQDKFTIQPGAPDSGFFTSHATNTINIEQPAGSAGDTAAQIAHEVGHALNDDTFLKHDMILSREEYVQGNVKNDMRNEGAAQFNAAIARDEVNAAGGPDIGMPGHQDAAFQQVFDDFRTGNLSRDQAVDRMAGLMENEHVSVPPHLPYLEYYRQFYEYNWDVIYDDPPLAPRRP